MHRHQRLDPVIEVDQAATVLVDRRDFPEHALRRGFITCKSLPEATVRAS
jgi:hypothetical protein